MGLATVSPEFSIMPNNGEGLNFLPSYLANDASIVNRYSPWIDVRARKEADSNGRTVLLIEDRFVSLSQIGEAPKLDHSRLYFGYVPVEVEARVPYSALFNHKTSEKVGNIHVQETNNRGISGGVWEDNPLQSVHAEIRRRMQVAEAFLPNSDGEISIKMNNGDVFSFEGLISKSSTSDFDLGTYNNLRVKEIGYATVLAANHLAEIPMGPGDYFLVAAEPANSDPSRQYLFAIEQQANTGLHLNRRFTVKALASKFIEVLNPFVTEQEQRFLDVIEPSMWHGSPNEVLFLLKIWGSADKAVVNNLLSTLQADLERREARTHMERGTKELLTEYFSGGDNGLAKIFFNTVQYFSPLFLDTLGEIVNPKPDHRVEIRQSVWQRAQEIANVHIRFANCEDSMTTSRYDIGHKAVAS